jgi:hypothetical protein
MSPMSYKAAPPRVAVRKVCNEVGSGEGGVERGQRNVGVVNLYRIARALDMSLSDLFAEVEAGKGRDCGG